MAEIHGQTGGRAESGLLDAGERGDAAQDFLIKGGALFWNAVIVFERIVGDGEPDLRGSEMVRFEPRADVEKMPKAAKHKARADEEDK